MKKFFNTSVLAVFSFFMLNNLAICGPTSGHQFTPSKADTSQQQVWEHLAQRKVFVIVDTHHDTARFELRDPKHIFWTEWNQSKKTTENLMKIVTRLNPDTESRITFYNSASMITGTVNQTNIHELDHFLSEWSPVSQPNSFLWSLHERLTVLYKEELKSLLMAKLPFSVFILGSGSTELSNDLDSKFWIFFNTMSRENRLSSSEKRGLAEFNFVRIGNRNAGSRFFNDVGRMFHPGVKINLLNSQIFEPANEPDTLLGV